MNRRAFIRNTGSILCMTSLNRLTFADLGKHDGKMDLSQVREYMQQYYNRLSDPNGPYGCYRSKKGERTNLFASVETAMTRTVLGEDFQTSLTEEERHEWIELINSYAYQPYGKTPDGSYSDGIYSKKKNGHPLWMNSKIIAALGLLGGKQPYPVKLYGDFNTEDKLVNWLEGYDWKWQWRNSHFFQGGPIYFSFSRSCSQTWLECAFNWLDHNLDETTGFWRKGVAAGDNVQQLGCGSLLLPLYQHHIRPFPYPERLLDSILERQSPSGRWFKVKRYHDMNFLEYDVLYMVGYLSSLVSMYRKDDIRNAIQKYSDLVIQFWPNRSAEFIPDKWSMAVFAMLQKLNPEQFYDTVQWTDWFGDKRFFQTDKVEIL